MNSDAASESEQSFVQPRSQYYLSRSEILKGVANRFVFSQFYAFFYLTMALLSLASVILSMTSECPVLAFFILEIIVNTAMICEVSIRLVAFGKQFWKSYYNILDLGITFFCVITVLVVFFSGCSAKGEEVFDDILLIVRNAIQFSRLAIVMRRSGKSIFGGGVPAIDLDGAQEEETLFQLDIDLSDDDLEFQERRRQGGER